MTNYTPEQYERDCKIIADAPNESSDLHINGCGMYFESRNDLESYHKVSDLRTNIALYEQLQKANARIAELEERLEVDPQHGYDGIACRDTTIKGLESRVAELKKERLYHLEYLSSYHPTGGWDEDYEAALKDE